MTYISKLHTIQLELKNELIKVPEQGIKEDYLIAQVSYSTTSTETKVRQRLQIMLDLALAIRDGDKIKWQG